MRVFSSLLHYSEASPNGFVAVNQLQRIWKPPLFPIALQSHLISLGSKFDLMYQITPDSFWIPSVSSNSSPDETMITAAWPSKMNRDQEVSRVYQFTSVPESLFSKLTVQLLRNDWAFKLAWKGGCLLSRSTNSAHVLIVMTSLYAYIRCTGEKKQKYLSTVIHMFRKIVQVRLYVAQTNRVTTE